MEHSERMHDSEEIRCSKLGHNLTFAYCRKEGIDKPCAKIVDCWSLRIDVLNYLNSQFGTKFLREFISGKKKDRMSSIIEAIDRTKEEKKEDGS